MTQGEAKIIAQSILDVEFKTFDFNVIIDDKYTVEFSRGWLFAYNIDHFVNDPSSEDFLITTRPIVVDRVDFSLSRIYDCDVVFTSEEEIINYYLKSKDKSGNRKSDE